MSANFDLQPWVTDSAGDGGRESDRAPHGRIVQRAAVRGRPSAACPLPPASPTASQNPNSMTTNMVPCSQNSANFYVAGMYPSSKYLMHWEEYSGTALVNTGSDLPFTTGPLPSTYPAKTFTVNVPAKRYDAAYPVLLFQRRTRPRPTLTAMCFGIFPITPA